MRPGRTKWQPPLVAHFSFSGAFDESMPPFTDSTPITSMILRQFFLEVVGAARLRFSVFRHYVWRSPSSHST